MRTRAAFLASMILTLLLLESCSNSTTGNNISLPGRNAGVVGLISQDNSGNPGDNRSGEISLSANGRFDAFDTFARNLTSPPPVSNDVYVHDSCVGIAPCTQSTALISVVNGTSVDGNNISSFPSISGDGRFVAFLSDATNLVTPNASFSQAYLRDTCLMTSACTPSVTMVSLTSSGFEPNGKAYAVALSANGRFVTFLSQATNIVSGVTIPNQTYMRDLCYTSIAPLANCQPQTILVSADNAGLPGNNASTATAAVSADGRFVAFNSTGSNLPGALNNSTKEVYLRDTCGLPNATVSGCTPATILVSADSTGNASAVGSTDPAISGNGRYISFTSIDPLAPNNASPSSNVFLRDTCRSASGPISGCTPSTSTVSVQSGGGSANSGSGAASGAIDSSGRFVVFESAATNLVSKSPPSDGGVYVRDTCNGAPVGCTATTLLVSVDAQGNFIAPFGGLYISSDGQYCSFVGRVNSMLEAVLASTGF